MNTRLYNFPSETEPGKRGRKKTKSEKLFSFREMIEIPDLEWKEVNAYFAKPLYYRMPDC